jgi:hypothetical protein
MRSNFLEGDSSSKYGTQNKRNSDKEKSKKIILASFNQE